MSEFTGKAAFVTGAASGIGLASAKSLASHGANVMLVDLNEEKLAAAAEDIRRVGGKCDYVVTDVSDPASVSAAINRTRSTFNGLHFAFNNAGVLGAERQLAQCSVEDLEKAFAVNFYGIFNCMKEQISHMLDNGGGAIVNTASMGGLIPWRNLTPYVASKHAVVGLGRCAALDYADRNIRVNTICPSYVPTPMTDAMFTPEQRAAVVASLPIRRACLPQNVADVVVWLLSDKSSFIVGADIQVDGGAHLGS